MIYGYARPLFNDINSKNQLNSLKEKCDVIYSEEHGPEKNDRLQLERLLSKVKHGDKIVVEKMAVLANSFQDFIELLKTCRTKKVKIYFLKEEIQSDELVSLEDIMTHIIQFQSDMIKQTTTMGMEEAKKKGKTIGRPKKPDENVKKAIAMYNKGYKLIDIKNKTGISKSTLYRYLESLEDN